MPEYFIMDASGNIFIGNGGLLAVAHSQVDAIVTVMVNGSSATVVDNNGDTIIYDE